jgi:predicted DNA-binding transcriptional regulator AlpA
MSKRFITPQEAAEYLGSGLSTLGIHRMNGTGPKYIKWGVNVRYDVRDLDEWMDAHRVVPDPVPPPNRQRPVGRPRKLAGVTA